VIQAAAPRLGHGVATGIGAVPFRAVRGAARSQADLHPLPSGSEVVVNAAERWACNSHAIKDLWGWGSSSLRSGVMRPPHLTHASATQQRQQAVTAERRPPSLPTWVEAPTS